MLGFRFVTVLDDYIVRTWREISLTPSGRFGAEYADKDDWNGPDLPV
jgi:hypothetical protein